jgi:hypothetical protein
MNARFISILAVCASLLSPLLCAAEAPMDFEKARQYLERRQHGETLTAAEA